MADSPDAVADDLAAMGAVVRAAAVRELDQQAELSRNRMADDTPRDRNVTAESWTNTSGGGGLTRWVSNSATDAKGRSIATILEFGWNDGQPDAIVEREYTVAKERVPDAVMDAVVESLP